VQALLKYIGVSAKNGRRFQNLRVRDFEEWRVLAGHALFFFVLWRPEIAVVFDYDKLHRTSVTEGLRYMLHHGK
jgi:hypothetical protein